MEDALIGHAAGLLNSARLGLHEREHILDARSLRTSIASRVVSRLGDLKDLDFSALDKQSRTLATLGVHAQCNVWSRKAIHKGILSARHNEPESRRELGLRVSDEVNQLRAGETLVLLPGHHHGAIVDADHKDLLDPCLLKSAVNLGFLEARDLARGSGGSEGSRQRHHQILSEARRHRFPSLDGTGVVSSEALVVHDRVSGEGITNLDHFG